MNLDPNSVERVPMTQFYEPPLYAKKAFSCPYCNAYAQMRWEQLVSLNGTPAILKTAECFRCNQRSVWRVSTENWKMIDPVLSRAPLPSEDLPEACAETFMEAREIANSSPRGAAALLRLCIQELCVFLGGEGKNLNHDIALLVRAGLPVRVQQSLDAIRVIGNNAVHPGEIPVNEEADNVFALFSLINMIVDQQITQPKHISQIFDSLPEGAREAVARRDKE